MDQELGGGWMDQVSRTLHILHCDLREEQQRDAGAWMDQDPDLVSRNQNRGLQIHDDSDIAAAWDAAGLRMD
jgi:hypothetical protein